VTSRVLNGAAAPTAIGLVLTGGGARAAYQVGVLKAVDDILRDRGGTARCSPFQVLAGTSAGAINACALACRADDYGLAVEELARVWGHFSVEQVYRADSLSVIRSGAPWLTMMSLGWLLTRWARVKPKSLLDNSPLRQLLLELIPWHRLGDMMQSGALAALAVTASSYTTGLHVTFYESQDDIDPWTRLQRIAVRARITPDHLLASAAIPFVFPSVSLACGEHTQWFGDGSMRQAAPISPAVHLGAQRVMVIGAGRMHEPSDRPLPPNVYPSVAQIAGHALSNIFLDALKVDIERMQRINATLALLDEAGRQRTALRPIEVLVIAPSQRLDDLAAQHVRSLPLTIRSLLRAVGISGRGQDSGGAALASYLLFEAPYTRALMALGESDTHARRADVVRFFEA
jgi:NTE family protein